MQTLAKVMVDASLINNNAGLGMFRMHNLNADYQGETMVSETEPQAEAPASMTVELAHECRELLTIIVFSLEKLQYRPLDGRGREQLKRAEQAARQIGEIVNRVSV